jgi:hypothetical protein
MGGLDHRGMLRKPQIVIGAEIQNPLAAGDFNAGILRRGNHAFLLVQAGFANLAQLPKNPLPHPAEHFNAPST